MPFKKGHPPSGGRPKGAKSKLTESFYEHCQRYFDDPDGFGGYEGLKNFFNKCPRNKELFVAMMGKWAEKQMAQAVEHSGPDGAPIKVNLQKVVTTVDPNGPHV